MKLFPKQLCLLLMAAAISVSQVAVAGAGTQSTDSSKSGPKEVPLSGTVLETMDGGGYTYILLKNGAEKNWVAAPVMKVAVGQEISLMPGFEMKNFTSKALNRKFDRIVFTAGVANAKGISLSPSAMKMIHAGVPAGNAKARPVAARKGAPISILQVKKAKGRNAYTIAQLYAKNLKLEKKPVLVRGRVVKVSPRILKRNWVHIQDGTGSDKKKNNNLIVTTKDLPQVGDVITVKGTLYNNRDYGSGYRYGVLVEASQIKN